MDYTIFECVGDNIERFLLEQGRTQQYLAEQLGVSKQVMSKIIAGAKAINVAEISVIAKTLGVSVDELLYCSKETENTHCFSFMGKVKNIETKRKIEFLQTVIDEILWLEEYADEK